MVGFAEISMAAMHVIVMVIGMVTYVNTRKLTELRFVSPHSNLLGFYIIYLSLMCLHLCQQNIDLIRITFVRFSYIDTIVSLLCLKV